MNKIDVLSKINEGMRAVLAKEDELAGNANDTSAGFEQMRLNYTAGRAYWVEGGPEMAEKVDCKVEARMGTSPFACTTPPRTAQALRTTARPCRRSSTRTAAASSWATWTRMIASAASWRARRAPRWQPWTTVFRPRRSSP